jgi:CheY-like chemotaxis protein/HPt (histidine-containing phosphotransfer) domain-containing protein
VAKVSETESSVTIKLSVQDTGVGIAPKALGVIFDAFTQADGSTTRKFGGSGLGLTISRQLVKLMHGEIGVESALGKGSIFWLVLPFGKQPALNYASDIPGYPELALRRVLVVDDKATSRQILQQQLRRLKMIDLYTESGREGLSLLRQHAAAGTPIDVAIIDLDTADLDGLTMAQSIQADPVVRSTRLIILAPLHRRLSTSVMQTTGISACIPKPVRQSRLFDVLVDVLSNEQSGDPESTGARPEGPGPRRHGTPLTEIKAVRVLVAEDNIVNQRLALRQLRKLGYYADAVSNGHEVLQALGTVRYDIILMDCQMPEMDGYEVSAAIRRQQTGGPRPYIIALTANALQGDRERCLQAGMNDYLTKPLQLTDLENTLQRALLRVQPVRRARGPGGSPEGLDTLDPAILAGLRELRSAENPDPLRELVDLFLKDARPRVQKLALTLTAKDWATLASTAHTLKGSANNLGAKRLASLLANLEIQAKSGNVSDSANILLNVGSEFQEVEAALLSELQKD